MSEYTQKYAFVTGSSRGIGRAIALRLAAEGYHIFLNCSRSFDALEETRQEIEKIGTCTLVPGDIGNPDTVRKIFHTIAKTCDHLDVLVNNAGISHIGLLMDMTDEDWDKVPIKQVIGKKGEVFDDKVWHEWYGEKEGTFCVKFRQI